MRWVHTLASVHSQWGGTSLPCLACGTPGRLICSCVGFTLSLSCPPWLHGRYPLQRYYGDSDPCSAPVGTRTGILDYGACTSRHSVSNHPMRPRSRQCFWLRAGLAPDSRLTAIGGASDFAHYSQSRQSHKAVSSLCRNARWRRCSTDYPFTSSCSPPRVTTTQLLSVTRREAPPARDFHPPCILPLKRTSAAVPAAATYEYSVA